MLVYIPLGSVIGCGIPLEFGRHLVEGNHNVCKVAVFVPYGGMDVRDGQVDQPGYLVA